jgi:hypothetical protein
MTLRRLSALRIFLFGGLSPVRTILIIEGATPFFFAHSFWLPARFTSERSKRIRSFWSSARMVCFRTAAFRWRPRRSAHTLLHFPAHRSPRPQSLRELNQGESPGGLAHPSKRGARYLGIGSGPSVKKSAGAGRKARLPNENASRAARGILNVSSPRTPRAQGGAVVAEHGESLVSNFIQTPSVNERILSCNASLEIRHVEPVVCYHLSRGAARI